MFQAGQVAKVAGVDPNTFQQWLKRELIPPMEGDGRNRLFSYKSLLQAAVAVALTKLNIPASQACKAAMHFAHIGSVEGGTIKRDAGRLFPTGRTYLVVVGSQTRVVNVPDGAANLDDLFIVDHRIADGGVLLDLGRVVDRVRMAIGLPGEDI